jgi:hypothetical protein
VELQMKSAHVSPFGRLELTMTPAPFKERPRRRKDRKKAKKI